MAKTYDLVVTTPFGPYRTGDEITDEAAIEAALAEHGPRVQRRALPPETTTGPKE